MSDSGRFFRHTKNRLQTLVYGNFIYRFLLGQGPVPERLRLSFSDAWPGNAAAGQDLMAQQDGVFEEDSSLSLTKRKPLLSHSWLRDLRAVGTESARRTARKLIEEWLTLYDHWQVDSWAPDVLGDRLSHWISFHDFYAQGASQEFEARLIASMVRQLRHLLRTTSPLLTGVKNLRIIKGLVLAGLSLLESEKALGLALDMLTRQLSTEILPDGGHISRNPDAQLQVLRLLIDIRAALRAAQLEVPSLLSLSIERMVPALKLFRHGDGGLALFNGGHDDNALEMEAVLTMAEARGRVLRRLPQTGYERIVAGRSLLLVDVGAPPPKPHDTTAHAGLLSFEFSVGRERLIVNCGTGPEDDADWRMATASTAAHSVLGLADTNAYGVLPRGGLSRRPTNITAQRYEQVGVPYVEAMHDGYFHKFRATYHRTLSLAAEGEELHGRETLTGPQGQEFTLRWHLHPSVQASLIQGGQAALLLMPSGSGWRLRLKPENFKGDLAMESSVYCGGRSPRRAIQLKVAGTMNADPTVIGWVLSREKKTS